MTHDLHQYQDPAPGDPYRAVETHMGYPAIRFWCRLHEEGAWARALVLDFWDLNDDWGSRDPYPLGPFLPETLSAQEITGQLVLFGDEFIVRGAMTISEVRIVSEPGSMTLVCAVALAMAWPWRNARTRFHRRQSGAMRRVDTPGS